MGRKFKKNIKNAKEMFEAGILALKGYSHDDIREKYGLKSGSIYIIMREIRNSGYKIFLYKDIIDQLERISYDVKIIADKNKSIKEDRLS